MRDGAKRQIWFERNEQAEALEVEGKTAEALVLYEANAREGCDLRFTYERLAAIYRAQQRYDEELDALQQAYLIERRRGPSSQLVRIEQRIETTLEIREREQRLQQERHRRAPARVSKADGGAGGQRGCLSSVALFLMIFAIVLAKGLT